MYYDEPIHDLGQVICFINCQNQGASRSIAQWAPIRALPLTQGSLIVSDPLLNCTSFQNQICPWVLKQWFIFERIQQKSQILQTCMVFAKYISFGLVILTRLCDWDAVFDWSQNLYSDFRLGILFFISINIPTERKMQIRILLQYTH